MRLHDLSVSRRAAVEALGTGLLLAIVVGSGIMGERLAQGNDAIALLANSLATGAGLYVLITAFGPLSGAHFNPAVSLCLAAIGRFSWRDAPMYVLAQCLGAVLGVWAAHLMFDLPVLEWSARVRSGPAQMFSEWVASFGLLLVITLGVTSRSRTLAWSVAAYITAAYWFTASTSFANPAVTLARTLTDTFVGIRPADASEFIAAQLLGAASGSLLVHWITRDSRTHERRPLATVGRGDDPTGRDAAPARPVPSA